MGRSGHHSKEELWLRVWCSGGAPSALPSCVWSWGHTDKRDPMVEWHLPWELQVSHRPGSGHDQHRQWGEKEVRSVQG